MQLLRISIRCVTSDSVAVVVKQMFPEVSALSCSMFFFLALLPVLCLNLYVAEQLTSHMSLSINSFIVDRAFFKRTKLQ